ncbi:uncharacterized protein M421DRAFT_328858 [Didymella exigua CBS 183.55]|uniref:Zn(2)-C6 fungal-type domain-containing protein n=1 Tax=Didymella exigua CBS 183.55 TaxID=1150837 RepID=A0A6A5R892_9PLEO|nr:uncharacterized protein M421DRAFT_328858 [Didymella exigua CBS 183.55]KAF1923194.1 hypothetical protein M421DRAFT_328858 [Didymella exigua CBS 183.55]
MSPPQAKSPTPKSGVTRTRTGCWTCRGRRKKCDETRPSCMACQGLNLQCEGYGLRLKWAIRGQPCVTIRHANLRKPKSKSPEVKLEADGTPVSWPNVSLGDCEDEKDQILLQYLGYDTFASLSKFERDVLYDFADWGALTLFAKPATESKPDPGRFKESLTYCAQSRLMLLNSLTYQITCDPKHSMHVDRYYGRSIKGFRQALSDPVCFQEEMTPYAGILLCSISMNRAMPFSIHLNGIASIFHQRFVLHSSTETSRELAGLIGVLDLPTHSLGRQNGHLHMWHDHCMGQTGVEEVSGLPCSLLDLFASMMDDDIEDRLSQWPGEPGEPVMCKIWEATQLAGLIRIRDLRLDQGLPAQPDRNAIVPAVRQVLDLLQGLRVRLDPSTFASTESLLLPLAAAGSQTSALIESDRTFIRECVNSLAGHSLSSYPYYEGVVSVLETLWASDGCKTLDSVSRDMGFELGLF